ncbi:hypothetical protein TRIP_E200037 [uncultured Spirochaetota bacterium]|nr:hypothetical protein TRIP_E200037 [uncultured Spirochaetota bacterium]
MRSFMVQKFFFLPSGDVEDNIGKLLGGAIVDYIVIFAGRDENRHIGTQLVFLTAYDIAALARKAVQAVFGFVLVPLGTFDGAGVGRLHGIDQEGKCLSPDRVFVDENPDVHPAFVADTPQRLVQRHR